MQEIISKRGKNSKTYDLGNGQNRVEIFQHPLHFESANGLEDIDTNIEFESGFGHKIKKANFNIRFNRKTLRFGFAKNVYIEYTLPIENKTVTGNRCVFENAWIQTDLEYLVKAEGVKNNIILKDSTAPTIFDFPVDAKGCTLEVANNAITIMADGTMVGIIPAPYALDANGDRGNVLISYANSVITFTADVNWLSNAIYPVIIDPSTFQSGRALNDGYIGGTSTFDNSNTYMQVGMTYEYHNMYSAWMGVTVPKDATITAANLSYKAYASASTTVPTKIYFNAIDDSFDPTNRTTYNALARTTANVAWSMPSFTAGTWYDSPDISSIVQEIVNRAGWVSGNWMMAMHDNNAAGSYAYRQVYTYDGGTTSGAKLVVTYSTGSAYTLTITSTNTTSLLLSKSINKIVNAISTLQSVCSKAVSKSVSAISTISATVRKAVTKPVSVVSTSVEILAKQGNKTIAGVITSLANSSRVAGKIINATVSLQSVVAKAVIKSIVTSTVLVSTVTKMIPKAISVINTLASNALKRGNKNITSSISQSSSVSKLPNKIITAITTSSEILTKNARKIITAVNTGALNVLKSTAKSIIASCNFVGSVVAQILTGLQTFYVNIVSLTTNSISLAKNANKAISTVNAITATLNKAAYKNITAITASVLSLVKSSCKNISTISTSASGIRKSINKTVLTVFTSSLNLARSTLKNLSTSMSVAASLISQALTGFITHYLTVTASARAELSASKLTNKILSPNVTALSALNKIITKTIIASYSIISSLFRSIPGMAGLFFQCYMYLKERVLKTTQIERRPVITLKSLSGGESMAVAGNTIRVQCEFKTFPTASLLADPTAITFKAYDEESRQIGSSVNIDSSNRLSTGIYYYDYFLPRGYRVINVEFSGTLEGSIITGKETIYIE